MMKKTALSMPTEERERESRFVSKKERRMTKTALFMLTEEREREPFCFKERTKDEKQNGSL
jgi:hypothetical protein